MVQRKIPDNAARGRTTPSFNATTVPAALLKAHHTTVWAELIVEAGAVTFVEEDPPWSIVLAAPASQPIVPNRKHHVEPSDDAVFRVQFYTEPGTSS